MKAQCNGITLDGTPAEIAEVMAAVIKSVKLAEPVDDEPAVQETEIVGDTVKRSGRRVDLFLRGQLVKHCRSVGEATDMVNAAGYYCSRVTVGAQLTKNGGEFRIGEYTIREIEHRNPGELFGTEVEK